MTFSEDPIDLPIEKKIGQLFFIGLPGPELNGSAATLIRDIQPGGVCLFSRNIRSAEQTRDLLAAVRQESTLAPLLSVDQEGGLVDRLRRVVTPMEAANKLRSAADATRQATIIAETLRLLGFNMNFAPVVDVMDAVRATLSNGVNSRAYGESKEDVAEFASAFLHGLQSNGIIGCVKHFPGLGAAAVDSHEELPVVPISREELYAKDLYPYRELLRRDLVCAVMVAHAAFPELDLQERDQDGRLLPSSLSFNIVTRLLREELGFEGLVLTDDLEMGAILRNYGIGEACVRAILAGHDMLAICAGLESIYEGYRAIVDAVDAGRISEQRLDASLRRINVIRSLLVEPVAFVESRFTTISDDISEFNSSLT
ncbi:MAG: glycoside hydrolase family 3 protein [Pyrinomonadaceae bacterium]